MSTGNGAGVRRTRLAVAPTDEPVRGGDRCGAALERGGVSSTDSHTNRPLSRKGRRRRRLVVLCLIALVAAMVVAMVLAMGRDEEAVLNVSAQDNLAGWIADGDAGHVTLTRVPLTHGPRGATSAVEVSRGAATGDWALTWAKLRDPARFFRVSHTYRMQVWVRDLTASGGRVDMLLANTNYRARPSDAWGTARLGDREWHLITRTFVALRDGGGSTGLYFALPASGPLDLQLTGASVKEVAPIPRAGAAAARRMSFAGPTGAAPNSADWVHEVGGGGWGNHELETYVDDSSTAHLDGGGHLVITALRQRTTGPDGVTREYKSARLRTTDAARVEPGSYVEASVRFPVGSGVWPAFWMVGSNFADAGWPGAGEMDIAEVYGHAPSVSNAALHMSRLRDPSRDFAYGPNEFGGSTDVGHPLDSQWHRFGVYFDGTMVQFYVDRKPRLIFTAEDAAASGRSWPFNHPFSILLNVAVGGDGNKDPANTSFPRSMVVGPLSIWHGGTPF